MTSSSGFHGLKIQARDVLDQNRFHESNWRKNPSKTRLGSVSEGTNFLTNEKQSGNRGELHIPYVYEMYICIVYTYKYICMYCVYIHHLCGGEEVTMNQSLKININLNDIGISIKEKGVWKPGIILSLALLLLTTLG